MNLMHNAMSFFIAGRSALIVACVLMLSSSALCQTSAKPNVIYILSDDLGYGELGCYGQKKIRTPVLDKMATEGIRFTQFYSGSTVCAPSRAALLTGFHTGHNAIRGNGSPAMAPEPASLGTLMKQAGYQTGIVGKWGMGGIGTTGAPLAQGFDEFVGYVGHTEAHQQYPAEMTRGNERFKLPEGTYANDVFTSEALDFVKRHKEQPFFLYLNYTIPHQKLMVPSQGIYANEAWPEKERNKAAMITRMDTGIGQLIGELEAHGLGKNTLIMFTSDNGPHTEDGTDPEFFKSSGPFRGIKRDLYEGGIRVPMIARWPNQIKSGVVSEQLWASWDVLPTLLDIAGAANIPKCDGVSIKPALLAGTPVQHGPLYWEFYERGFTQAVRKDDWKLLKTTTGSLELYDLKSDSGETDSLTSRRPEVVVELLPLLTSMRTESERWNVSEAGKKKKKNKRANRKNK